MRILVLGVSGMLGNAMFRTLSQVQGFDVFGSARSASVKNAFSVELSSQIFSGTDVDNADSLALLFAKAKPNVVINCIGLIKQLADANDPLLALPINAMLPHRLARLCELASARLVHISTDCVFAGTVGNYSETDAADAEDLYGRSKYLGEVSYPHTVTLRTSIIGHELHSMNGLIGWFLAQSGSIKGYSHAIFSGVPTVELAEIVRDIILPKPELSGLYQVASEPISKFDLLRLVAEIYGKEIDIVADGSLRIDRSLDPAKFHGATGYTAPSWKELITKMYKFQ